MSKISELSDGGSLQSTDYLIAVRSGGNVKVQADGNLSLGALTLTGLTVSGVVQATGYLAVEGTTGNTGLGTDRWIGGDGTAGTWFYNVPTGSNHYFGVNNSNILAINSTGIDVTGTVTADGLTVDGTVTIDGGASANTVLTLDSSTANTYLKITDSNSTNGAFIGAATNDLNFYPNNVLSATFAANGDISFYEDTGTTESLVWDSSLTQLKITGRETSRGGGVYAFDVDNSAQSSNLTSAGAMRVKGFYGDSLIVNGLGDVSFFDDSGNAKFFWDASAESLGIGTSSPTDYIHIHNTADSTALIHFTNGATGSATSDGFKAGVTVGGDAYLRQREAANLLFYTSDTERMRIDSSGNLLVGATSSDGVGAARVQIGQLGSTAQLLVKNATGHAGLYATGTSVYQTWASGGFLALGEAPTDGTSFTERMRIDSSGNLLVGTTDDAGTNAEGFLLYDGSGGSRLYIGHVNGTANGTQYAVFNYNSGKIGDIVQSGTTAVLYNISSDARLKENIADAEDASELIDAIQVRSFDWKVDGSHQKYGMVAQELVTVAPEAVSVPEDPEEMMGVDYSKLVPMLVKEIQSLRARVAQLEGV